MRILKYIALLSLGLILACSSAVRRTPSTSSRPITDPFATYDAYEHFVQGDLLEQSGDLDGAAGEYRKALILDPGSVEIRRVLSEIYYEQKKYDEGAILRSEISEKEVDDYNYIGDCLRNTKDFESAAKFYLRSLDLDSTQYETRAYVARIMHFLGKEKEAEKQYRILVNFAPNKLEGLLDLAGFYIKANEMDKAIGAYTQAALIDSADIRPRVGLASVQLAKGDTLAADSLYFSIAHRNWDDPEMLGSLIVVFYNNHDYIKAESLAARMSSLLPDDTGAEKRYAMILFGNRNFDKAETLMIDLDRKGAADGGIYFYLARIKQDRKDLPAAEGYYRKSLALADTVADSWINLALVVDQQKRYQESLDIMADAISAIPQDSEAVIFYTAFIHSRNDHFDLAKEGFERLLRSNPNDIGVKFRLSSAEERLGNYEAAEKGFKWIIQKDPKNALALNYLGYMYADRGIKLKEANDLIERALAIDPDNGAYLDSYAWVLYKMGNYDKALEQMKKAVKPDTDDPLIYDHQGDIYSALRQEAQARESWGKALELKPDDQAIRAKLYPR